MTNDRSEILKIDSKTKPTILLDTDIGNDVDDVIAICLLFRLVRLGYINYAGTLISNDVPNAENLVSVISKYYGVNFPIAKVKNGVKGSPDRYILPTLEKVNRRLDADVYCHQNMHSFLKEMQSIKGCRDISLLTIGFFTNLRRIIENNKEAEILNSMCRNSYHMAGNFEQQKREHNILMAPNDFEKFIERWQKPSIFCGFEQGLRVQFKYKWIAELEDKSPGHPLIFAYYAFRTSNYDRPCWDPVTSLIASKIVTRHFEYSEPGTVEIVWSKQEPCTVFRTSKGKFHRYVKMRKEREGIIESLIRTLLIEDDQKCHETIKKNVEFM